MKKSKPRASLFNIKEKTSSPLLKGFWYLAIPFFAFFLYSGTINFDYNGDDDAVTRSNRYVQQGISGIGEIFTTGYYEGFLLAEKASNDKLYRPLPLAHFALEKQIWGNDPKSAHSFNVVYYALCCLLLFVFLKNILPAASPLIPVLIALLYAAHPVHTEVVANIKSRDEILCALLLLIALICIVKFMRTTNKLFLVPAVVSYALALLSKEGAITFVALTPLTLFFVQTTFNKKDWAITLLPILAVTAMYLLLRNQILGSLTNSELGIMDNALFAATTFGELLATNFVILWKYLQLLFFPHPLSWDYSYNQIPIVNFLNPLALFSIITHALLLAYALFALRKKNWIAYGILFYFITLSVSSNLVVKIGSTMAERFLFVPSIGFCIAIVLAGEKLLGFVNPPLLRKVAVAAAILVPLALFSLKTATHVQVWRTPFTLLEYGTKAAPNSARTHLFLGHEYRDAAAQKTDPIKQTMDVRKAINCYKRSIDIYPAYGGALHSIGSAYHSLGMVDSALFFFKKISTDDKEFSKACFSIGDAWFSRGNADSALHYFLLVSPDDISYGLACNSIGFIYAQMNRPDDALLSFKRVPAENPAYGKACNNIAKLYLNYSQLDSALRYFLLVPETESAFASARLNAGNIYLQKRFYTEALGVFNKIKPGDGVAYRDAQFFTGRVYYEQGNAQAALTAFEKTISLDSTFKPAYEALSRLFEALGNKESADYYAKQAAGL